MITTMDTVTLREPRPEEDAPELGRIVHEAFTAIAERHGFPSDFPDLDSGTAAISHFTSAPGIHGVVAERDGRVIGSNFLDERSTIAAVGPITVDPAVQDGGAGRLLMDAVLRRAEGKGFPGVRLVQAAYHGRSLALYAKLGFDAREELVTLQGPPIKEGIEGYDARPAGEADLEAINKLSLDAHGHDRAGEVRAALGQGGVSVVEHDGVSRRRAGVRWARLQPAGEEWRGVPLGPGPRPARGADDDSDDDRDLQRAAERVAAVGSVLNGSDPWRASSAATM
jgi:predicted N-acetyltransferase YhbS